MHAIFNSTEGAILIGTVDDHRRVTDVKDFTNDALWAAVEYVRRSLGSGGAITFSDGTTATIMITQGERPV